MKCSLPLILLLGSLCTTSVGAQLSIDYYGPGCGATSGYPHNYKRAVSFTLWDPYLRTWQCGTSTAGSGTLFLFFAPPKTPNFALPSIHKGCLLHSSIGVMLTFKASGAPLDVFLGYHPPSTKFDVVLQGVLVLTTSGNGRTCPAYVTATPAWRLRQ